MTQYAVCIKDKDYPSSLEVRKLYQVILDNSANALSLIRIVDESGESYLYPAEYFFHVRLSPAVQKAIRLAS